MADEVRHDRRPAFGADQLVEKVSAYKLQVWGRCQALFKYLYVDGLWGRPSAAMAFGTAFDRTLDAGYREKRDRGVDPTPADAAERFAAAFEEETAEVEDWEGEQPGPLKDEGARHAQFWAERTAPRVVPHDVHRSFLLHVGDWSVRGEIDLTMEFANPEEVPPEWRGIYVVDHKTSKKSWSAAKAREQLQSVFYAMAARSGQLVDGVDPSRVAYEVSVRLKSPKRQRFVVGVGQADVAGAVNRIETARRGWRAAFNAGAFYPNREHFMCSRRWCAHWRRCESEHGGRVKP